MAKKNILIVIDVQNDFITGTLRNEEAIKALPNIVNLVKTQKFDGIYATLDTHFDETYFDTLEGKKLPVKHCVKGTWGWDFPDELKAAFGGNLPRIFEKNTFGSTYLAGNLRATLESDWANYKDYEFTIVGFCTDICVVSNALLLRATFPNNTIKVLKDCVAGVTPESNEAALKTLQMCQIEVI